MLLSSWKGKYVSYLWKEKENTLENFSIPKITKGINSSVFSKEGNIFVGINSNQDGIFRSTDRGLNWTELYEGLDHRLVYSLAIDSSGILYAGTDSGIYRSKETVLLSIEEQEISLNEFKIIPNPFNQNFEVSFYLEKLSNVRFSLIDILGNKTILKENQFYSSGKNSITIENLKLNSGVYFILLETAEGIKVKKAIVIK